MFQGPGAVILPIVALVMTAVGLVAALGPARWGLSIQPTEALRGVTYSPAGGNRSGLSRCGLTANQSASVSWWLARCRSSAWSACSSSPCVPCQTASVWQWFWGCAF
jgi:hypothetical protein